MKNAHVMMQALLFAFCLLPTSASAAVTQAQGAVAHLKQNAEQAGDRTATQQAAQAGNRLVGALTLVVKAEQRLQ